MAQHCLRLNTSQTLRQIGTLLNPGSHCKVCLINQHKRLNLRNIYNGSFKQRSRCYTSSTKPCSSQNMQMQQSERIYDDKDDVSFAELSSQCGDVSAVDIIEEKPPKDPTRDVDDGDSPKSVSETTYFKVGTVDHSFSKSDDKFEDPHIESLYYAEQIVDKVKSVLDIKNDDSLYIDQSAGRGFLSQALLNAGARNLVMCHKNLKYAEGLQQLADGRDDVHVYDTSMVDPSDRFADYNSSTSTRSDDVGRPYHFYDDPSFQRSWDSEPAVRLFLVDLYSEVERLTTLCITQLLSKQGLARLGRFDIFMVARHELADSFMSDDMSTELLFTYKMKFLFDFQYLGELDISSLCLAGSSKPNRLVSSALPKLKLNSRICLLRLTPKIDPFGDGDYENFSKFVIPLFYLTQQCMKYKRRIVTELENVLSNAGLKIVSMGYDSFTDLRHITHAEFIEIIKAIQTLPGYDKSVLAVSKPSTGAFVGLDEN